VTALLVVLLLVVAGAAAATVAVADPARQAACAGVYGLALALLFVALQAPDVALSELVVSGIALPAMVLFAVARADAEGDRRRR
jgi:energy-converting hydrogenase B subunit D